MEKTNVSADKNPNYSTDPGNATTDKVFLLSANEVNKYFGSDEDRKCIPTEYAKANGAYTESKYTKNSVLTCFYWLRSPSDDQYGATRVYGDGSVNSSRYAIDDGSCCVRPTVWLSIK